MGKNSVILRVDPEFKKVVEDFTKKNNVKTREATRELAKIYKMTSIKTGGKIRIPLEVRF